MMTASATAQIAKSRPPRRLRGTSDFCWTGNICERSLSVYEWFGERFTRSSRRAGENRFSPPLRALRVNPFPLNLAQSRRDRRPRRAQRRQHAADDAGDQRDQYPVERHRTIDAEIERNLREGLEVRRSRRDGVDRQREKQSGEAAEKRDERALDDYGQNDRAPFEAEGAQGGQ